MAPNGGRRCRADSRGCGATRRRREPDQVEIRKLDEEEARMRVKRRPSPAGPGQGIASRRAVS